MPALLLLLLTSQIPINADPFQCEVEQVFRAVLRVPEYRLVWGGSELQVGYVRGEDVEAVKDVRGVCTRVSGISIT